MHVFANPVTIILPRMVAKTGDGKQLIDPSLLLYRMLTTIAINAIVRISIFFVSISNFKKISQTIIEFLSYEYRYVHAIAQP